MFVGSKSASGAGVVGQISTSRQTDFDNERQNKQVGSNKHVSSSQTNALKYQTKGVKNKNKCVIVGVELSHLYFLPSC